MYAKKESVRRLQCRRMRARERVKLRERERREEQSPCNKVHTYIGATTLCTVRALPLSLLQRIIWQAYCMGARSSSSSAVEASHDTHTHTQTLMHTPYTAFPIQIQTLLNYWGALCVFNLYRHSTMGVVIEPPWRTCKSNQSKSKLIVPSGICRVNVHMHNI